MFQILTDQNGQDSVEYAALAALGIIIAILAYRILKNRVDTNTQKVDWETP